VPNTLFLNLYAQGFRQFIATSFCIDQITDLSRIDVFKGATVRTAIPFMRKAHADDHVVQFVRFDTESFTTALGKEVQGELVKDDNNWVRGIGGANTTLGNKIAAITVPLNEILEVSQGLIPYDKYRGMQITRKTRPTSKNYAVVISPDMPLLGIENSGLVTALG
jgi:hypothetical protein